MASRTLVQLFDDLDDEEIPEGKGGAVEFGLDRTDYVIDLGEKNAARLREALAPFIEAARKVRSNGSRKASAKNFSREESAEIREWAKARGIKINERGRIPIPVTDAYRRNDPAMLIGTPHAPEMVTEAAETATEEPEPVPEEETPEEPQEEPEPITTGAMKAADTGGNRNAAIREWAKGQGIKVGDKGRIPAFVVKAYEEATQETPEAPEEPTPAPAVNFSHGATTLDEKPNSTKTKPKARGGNAAER